MDSEGTGIVTEQRDHGAGGPRGRPAAPRAPIQEHGQPASAPQQPVPALPGESTMQPARHRLPRGEVGTGLLLLLLKLYIETDRRDTAVFKYYLQAALF